MGIRKVEMEKSAANFERFGERERGRLFVEGNKRGPPRMCDYCGRITCLWICPLTALLLLFAAAAAATQVGEVSHAINGWTFH